MKYILVLAFVFLTLFCRAQYMEVENPNFKSLFALRADGEFIDVTTGHAAPLIYDFNGDGTDDLLVGEFGIHTCPDMPGYVQGRCRVYINHGTNKMPVYHDFQYLSAGGQPMYVPVTCCISLVPRMADLDADGIDDVVSGSYPGMIFFWKGKGNQEFGPRQVVRTAEGDTLKLDVGSIAADPFDWDNDGDLDIFVSTRGCGFYLIENVGDAKEYKFVRPEKLAFKDNTWWLNYLMPFDWDGDGLFDLVGGKEFGDVIWMKNIGKAGKPEFAKLEVLWDNPEHKVLKEYVEPIGGRPKICIYDYDRDGKADILMGDASETEKVLWELSPKEQRQRARLDKVLKSYSKDFFDKHPDIWKLYQKNDPSLKKNKDFVKYENKERELWEEWEYFNRNKERLMHGYVWVFLRK